MNLFFKRSVKKTFAGTTLCLLFNAWAVSAKPLEKAPNSYLDEYAPVAVREKYRSHIPASIKLGQAILESDWGRGTLANQANNHFGIKCHNTWNGDSMEQVDDDYDEEGNLIPSCFRVYQNSLQSYLDHSNFLLSATRYKFLFQYNESDYVNWAIGLQEAGYATDPNYAKKLINVIESYELYNYDKIEAVPDVIDVVEGYNMTKKNTMLTNEAIPNKKTSGKNAQKIITTPKTKAIKLPSNYRKGDGAKYGHMYQDVSSSQSEGISKGNLTTTIRENYTISQTPKTPETNKKTTSRIFYDALVKKRN